MKYLITSIRVMLIICSGYILGTFWGIMIVTTKMFWEKNYYGISTLSGAILVVSILYPIYMFLNEIQKDKRC